MQDCSLDVGVTVALNAQEREEEEGRVGLVVVEGKRRVSRILRKGPGHANPIRQSARPKFNT